MFSTVDDTLNELSRLIAENNLTFGLFSKQLVSIAKTYCSEEVVFQDLRLKFSKFNKLWEEAPIRDKCAQVYSAHERRFLQYVAIKSPHFPSYNAHYLVKNQIAVGEGPVLEFRYPDLEYDNRKQFIKSILDNSISRLIVLGAHWEDRSQYGRPNKFFKLFDPKKPVLLGHYRVQSVLVTQGHEMDEYKLFISEMSDSEVVCPVTHEIEVEHFFLIGDNDEGFPAHSEIIGSLIKNAFLLEKDESQRIFCHCSAGIGRSGVFALLLFLIMNRDKLNELPAMQMAQFILSVWHSFNCIRPGTIGSARLLFGAVQLYYEVIRVIVTQCTPHDPRARTAQRPPVV